MTQVYCVMCGCLTEDAHTVVVFTSGFHYEQGEKLNVGMCQTMENEIEYPNGKPPVAEETPQKYWLVGIDGTKTLDPRYWFDRWEVIKAGFAGQAVTKWCERRKGWLRDSEVKYVEIWYVSDTPFSELKWMRENVEWGPGKYDAKIKVGPLGAVTRVAQD